MIMAENDPKKPNQTRKIETDLFIIGSGFAGMSAAVFAANRKIKTVVTGAAGSFEYASGLMDLWGTSLTRKNPKNKVSKKPWDMLSILHEQQPGHPLAKLAKGTINQAFSELLTTLKNHGLTYTGHKALNHLVLTPFGTQHPTYRLPLTMKANADAFKTKPPCLILDFRGLREFSAQFFRQMLKKDWPHLDAQCIEFPGTNMRSEVFTPFLAQSFETEPVQDQFIKKVKPLLKGKTCLGVPAILGLQSVDTIVERLKAELNVQVFEIPTSPVSVPGNRLKETLVKSLENTSVTRLSNQRVIKILQASDKGFECLVGSNTTPVTIRSKAVLLATGRFLSKGLFANQYTIKETLFDLPVTAPDRRENWHQQDYFCREGHLINQAGIEIDSLFRPVCTANKPIYKSLFASGTILAHQDWVRNKCGSGLAIGTSFAAIESYLQIIQGTC